MSSGHRFPDRSLAHVAIHLELRGPGLDPAARCCYADGLGRALAGADARLLFYAALADRVELVLEPGATALAAELGDAHTRVAAELAATRAMARPLSARYAERRWPGAALARRLAAHVHNAPVRAGEALSAWGSPTTSHCAYVGLAAAPPWLAVRRGLALCGLPFSPHGRRQLDELVVRQAGARRWSPDDERGAELDTGPLGPAPSRPAPRFLCSLETFTERWPVRAVTESAVTAPVSTRVPRAIEPETTGPIAWPPDLDELVARAAELFYLSEAALRGPGQGAALDTARAAVAWAFSARLGGAAPRALAALAPESAARWAATSDALSAEARRHGDWLADEYRARRAVPDPTPPTPSRPTHPPAAAPARARVRAR